MDAKSQQRLLLYLPHDAKAIQEQRWCNSFFPTGIPNAPLVCLSSRSLNVLPLTTHPDAISA